MKHMQRGFTLVEIAIVLVIIGLLLGGILKGQELITNAKVRNVADQQNAVKAAIYAFQDRFRALPGDYNQASVNIPNTSFTAASTGNSKIDTVAESVQAWHQLAAAGFISCSPCAADPGTAAAATQSNSMTNAYNGIMLLTYDPNYYSVSPPTAVNNLKSGNLIPSNILAEVDRKIDDGDPTTGTMRFSNAQVQPTATTDTDCATAATAGPPSVPGSWAAASPNTNCGAANIL
jgi:prepilin-type N-terminal cleavage/methylation domain-containing protein